MHGLKLAVTVAAGWFALLACSTADQTFDATGGPCEVAGTTCTVGCDPQMGCVDCRSDADCGAASPICIAGECVAQCQGDADCDGDEQCDPNRGACVECLADADCDGDEPLCISAAGRCGECLNSEACDCQEPICDLSEGECQECVVDADCGAVEFCIEHKCRDREAERCAEDEDCVGERSKCEDNVCVAD